MNFIILLDRHRHLRRRRRVARAGHRDLEQQRILGGHRVLRTHSVAHQHVHQADSADPLAAGDRAHPGHLLSRGEHASALHRRVARQRAVGAGFYIASFGSALVASIVISLVSALVNGLIGNDA